MTFANDLKAAVHYYRAIRRPPLSKLQAKEKQRETNESLRRKLRWDATVKRMCEMAVAEALGVEQ